MRSEAPKPNSNPDDSQTPEPAAATAGGEDFDLVLQRVIPAAPARVYQAWTDPALMLKWFTPAPWQTVRVDSDVRVGGASLIVMRGPDGSEHANRGVYLEVVPGRRLVFTDAYTEAWVPSAKPFFTGILTFDDAPDGATLYTARVRHWSAADKAQHEAMGFHAGWGQATDQMVALLTGG